MDSAPTVTLDISSCLPDLLANADEMRAAVAAAIRPLLRDLGVPGDLAVGVTAVADDGTRTSALGVSVNGHDCPCPDEFLHTASAYVRGVHPAIAVAPRALVEQSAANAAFVSLVCAASIGLQPSTLLGAEQATAYRASLPDLSAPAAADPAAPARLHGILAAVLDQGVSIADQAAVATILADSSTRSPDDVVETLIDALSPPSIDIELPLALLRSITMDDPTNAERMIPLMRTSVFAQLGALVPALHLRPVDDLRPASFRFRFGSLATLPMLGLGADDLLVEPSADRPLPASSGGRPAPVHPITGARMLLVDRSERAAANEAGLLSLNQSEYLVLSLVRALRWWLPRLVTRSVVQQQVHALEPILPSLVAATGRRLSVETLTRIVRHLASEHVPTRNWRALLETLVDWADALGPQARGADTAGPQERGDLDLEGAAAWVRARADRALVAGHADADTALAVWQLGPDAEAVVAALPLRPGPYAAGTREQDQRRRQVVHAIRARMPAGQDGSQTARIALLAPDALRSRLSALVAFELPNVHVLSRADLPVTTRFVIRGTISLT